MIIHTTLVPSTDCIDGSVRLVDGRLSHEGRVEVCVNQTWSTVSSDNWGRAEALAVCQQLGIADQGIVHYFITSIELHVCNTKSVEHLHVLYNYMPVILSIYTKFNMYTGVAPTSGGFFGMGIGQILEVECNNNESNLTSCDLKSNDRNYDHSSDAGVVCFSPFIATLCSDPNVFSTECELQGVLVATTTDNKPLINRFPVIGLAVIVGVETMILIAVVTAWICSCFIKKRQTKHENPSAIVK